VNGILDLIQSEDISRIIKVLEFDPGLVNMPIDEWTPLHWACQLSSVEAAKALIDAGADINARDSDGETPLHIACSEGQVDIVKLLLESEVLDINNETDEGKTALMFAAQACSCETCKMLLEKGANPGHSDAAGRTVLHWAALGEEENLCVADLFISVGVDPKIKNCYGDTAIDYAVQMSNKSMQAALCTKEN